MDLVARFLRSGQPVGLKIIIVSMAGGLLGMLPLLAYIALGPADGNPIGLGLLMLLSWFLAFVGVVIGLASLLLADLRRRLA